MQTKLSFPEPDENEPSTRTGREPRISNGKRVRHERVNVGDPRLLPAPRHAQREWTPSNAKEKAENFKPDQLGTVVISEREGWYYLLDGQHRIGAARMVGWKGSVQAEVWSGLSIKEEADFFLTRNEQKAVTKIDRFGPRVARGDSALVQVAAILEENGLHVTSSVSKNGFHAVVAAERITTRYGATLFSRVIRTLTTAWKNNPDGVSANLVNGMSEFYVTFGEKAAEDRVVKALAKSTPFKIQGVGRDLAKVSDNPVAWGVAEAIRREYNKGLSAKNALPSGSI